MCSIYINVFHCYVHILELLRFVMGKDINLVIHVKMENRCWKLATNNWFHDLFYRIDVLNQQMGFPMARRYNIQENHLSVYINFKTTVWTPFVVMNSMYHNLKAWHFIAKVRFIIHWLWRVFVTATQLTNWNTEIYFTGKRFSDMNELFRQTFIANINV